MQIDNEKYHEFVRKKQTEDQIFQHHRRNQVPISHLDAGKFGLFLMNQKDIFRLYRQLQINSPSANRIFLYLLEHCLGYHENPRSEMDFNIKKLIKQCNIKNRKSLYDGIQYLQDRNLIFLLQKEEGKVIKLNSSILSWNVDEERRDKIYKKEIERLGISDS